MAADLKPAPDPQAPKPRIVQYDNRRHSIRLEPVFWQALETQAERRGLRLGRYVGELAEAFAGPNFSSHLRVLCMLEHEQDLVQARLRPGRVSAVDLVLTAYGPGLVLSHYRTIIAYNAGFLDWLGRERRPAPGSELTAVVQVRTRRPLNDIWLDLVAGTIVTAEVNILHVLPGRVLAAPARLIAIPDSDSGAFYAVLWISTGRRPGGERPARAPAQHPAPG